MYVNLLLENVFRRIKDFLITHQIVKFREGTFFLGGGGGAGALEGRVSSESGHQKGRAILLCQLFKGRITHLFQNFC